jgi:hypothetical protein
MDHSFIQHTEISQLGITSVPYGGHCARSQGGTEVMYCVSGPELEGVMLRESA